MLSDKLVTIITPVFNGEKYLSRFFNQIRALTHKNIELIIVNDGSSDKSSELIRLYADSDERIVFIDKKENGGVSAARNDALDVATGKHVFFFDCDDTFEPDIISACLRVAENEDETVCYNYASIRKSGEVGTHIFSYKKAWYDKKEKVELLTCSFGMSIEELLEYLTGKREMREGKELNGPWRIMYSAQVLNNSKLRFDTNLRVGEDTIFTNEYLSKCGKVKTLNKVLYYLHNNENSTIDTYNRDIERMIDGKLLLIEAKRKLAERVANELSINANNLWGGEYILSSIQIGWALANNKDKKLREKVKDLKKYHTNNLVRNQWEKVSIGAIIRCKSIKAIPVLLLKMKLCYLTEFLLCILRECGWSIG